MKFYPVPLYLKSALTRFFAGPNIPPSVCICTFRVSGLIKKSERLGSGLLSFFRAENCFGERAISHPRLFEYGQHVVNRVSPVFGRTNKPRDQRCFDLLPARFQILEHSFLLFFVTHTAEPTKKRVRSARV
jgi:hypothetical protein